MSIRRTSVEEAKKWEQDYRIAEFSEFIEDRLIQPEFFEKYQTAEYLEISKTIIQMITYIEHELGNEEIGTIGEFLRMIKDYPLNRHYSGPIRNKLLAFKQSPLLTLARKSMDKLMTGPGFKFINIVGVLYDCIYKFSPVIRSHFRLTPRPLIPEEKKMKPTGSTDEARKEVHVNETHKESDTDDATCTGASCGGLFDYITGRKGGTRRRNKKRKSRKSKKRTNRIR